MLAKLKKNTKISFSKKISSQPNKKCQAGVIKNVKVEEKVAMVGERVAIGVGEKNSQMFSQVN